MSQAEFDTAYADAGKLLGGTDNDKLEFYALGKVAKGDDITSAPAPGTFDFKGKYKRREWQKLVDEKVTPEDAMKQYVAKFEKMKTEHGLKA